VLNDGTWRHKYDDNIKIGQVHSKVAANVYTLYQVSKEKGIWPAKVSSRDFLMLSYTEKTTDGAFKMATFYDKAFDCQIPTTKEYVRGIVHIGGW
jgi:hypothetical protein